MSDTNSPTTCNCSNGSVCARYFTALRLRHRMKMLSAAMHTCPWSSVFCPTTASATSRSRAASAARSDARSSSIFSRAISLLSPNDSFCFLFEYAVRSAFSLSTRAVSLLSSARRSAFVAASVSCRSRISGISSYSGLAFITDSRYSLYRTFLARRSAASSDRVFRSASARVSSSISTSFCRRILISSAALRSARVRLLSFS
mmetsp:Transcript_11674/g.42056  ORF Transcript_11674/g.42056 Transcript_11674/m.42056 type:complete len:202 (+) Transcript_11674:97-702(+)